MSQRSSITFRCPPTTGVLSRLTAGPLPGLLTKWPLSAALLGLDLDPGSQPTGMKISAFTAAGAFDFTHVTFLSVQAALANHARMRSGRGVSIDRASASRSASSRMSLTMPSACRASSGRSLGTPRGPLVGRIARWLPRLKRRGASALEWDRDDDHLHVAACSVVPEVLDHCAPLASSPRCDGVSRCGPK